MQNAQAGEVAEEWLAELKKAETGQVERFFVDESTLGWLPVLRTCWMKKGCQNPIPTPGHQQCRYIFGAYNWAMDEVIYLLSMKRNCETLIAFLVHLAAQHSGERPLVIVLDNGSIHRSQACRAAIALLEKQLLPLPFPRYCSQLNPIARYWKHLKSLACGNKLFADMKALLASLDKALL